MVQKFHLVDILKRLFFRILNSFSKHIEKLPENLVKTVKFDGDEIFVNSIFVI